jgi:hypothetical protein
VAQFWHPQAFRVRRWRASTRQARQSYRLSARSAQAISAARRNKAARPAIEAPRPRHYQGRSHPDNPGEPMSHALDIGLAAAATAIVVYLFSL